MFMYVVHVLSLLSAMSAVRILCHIYLSVYDVSANKMHVCTVCVLCVCNVGARHSSVHAGVCALNGWYPLLAYNLACQGNDVGMAQELQHPDFPVGPESLLGMREGP